MRRLSGGKSIGLIILALIVVAGLGLWYRASHKSAAEVAREKGNVSGQLDRQNAQHKKKSSGSSSGSNSTASSDDNLKSVTPILSRWNGSTDPVEVAGYVPNVLEDGGTCSYVFTKDSLTFTKTSAGFQDVSHTTCTPVDVNRNSFSQTGSWSVVLKYKSSTYSGASNQQNLTIK